MAETTKTVLLVDYDSLHRSLSAGDQAAVERFAPRIASWIGAIEAGGLFAGRPEEPQRRRVLIRRCYADPALLGDDRAAFLSNGFQVIDCPPAEGRENNAASIHMVLDSIDALDHPTGYEEFVLLSADSDLSPLLIRLRAHNRMTAIYTNSVTAESYKAIADAMIDESRFMAILLADDEPAEEEAVETPPPPQAERSEVEAIARKISSATNVPLFAPRTFAELFRHLVEEISENGYHFQTTAENVATRMADAGRNVSRRQVVFVVKGLALKGHVFSTGDTADRLADVFREQVLYLAENAGVELDEDEQRVLAAWIVGQAPPPPAAPAKGGESQESGDDTKTETKASTQKPATPQPSRSSRRRQAKSSNSAKAREEQKPVEQPAKPAPQSAKPASDVEEPADKPLEEPKPSAPSTTKAAPASEKPPASAPKPTTPSSRTDSPTAAANARSSSSGSRISSGATAGAGTSKNRPAATAKPSAASPGAKAEKANSDNTDAVESSILAAIAQAVDVLVEDSGAETATTAEPERKAVAPAEKNPPPSEAEGSQDAEGDDIGDEIQRIIASYSRNRNKDEQD